MSAAPIVLGITIRANGSAQVVGDINQVQAAVTGAGNAAQNTNRSFAAMARETLGLGSALKVLAGALGGLSVIEVAKQIIGVNREFETLRTSLITTTGSIEKAGLAFKFIQDFAAKTPFDVQQVTESFIKLGNLGLKPSEAALRSYGNTAAAQAKPIMQMIEAVADAATGEFERLKEFGIKAKVHGDNVGFVFQGVTTEVKNNAQAIEGYLINLGNTKFGDAMANQSKTINGSISTLSDTWSTFMDNLLDDAKENMIAKWVQTAGDALHWLDVQMNGAIRSADKLAEVDARIAANKASLNAHDKNGVVGSLVDGLAGYDPSLVKNRIDADIKLRETLTKTIEGEKKAQDALVATMGVSTTTQDQSTASKKAQEKAAKEAAKAQESLAKSFADTLSGLSLHNIELSKTAREHKEAELSAKGYTQAMIAQAMALYDIGTALEAKKKLNEDEKAQLDSLIDRYNKVTMSARDYYASTLTTTGPDGTKAPIPSADQAPIMAQFDKTTGAETAKAANDAATASLDSYNKSLDDANKKTSDLGAVTSAIFDGALGGISAMAGAFDSMVNSIGANTKALEENAAMQKLNEATIDPVKKAANFEKYAKVEAKLNNDNVKAQLTGASQLAGAAANLFDKKSAAAKGFHAIEVGLSVLRLAMDAKEMASSIMKTGTNIMEGASKMFGQSGWFAFAGVAAMLALMAGLGFSGKGSSGSSTPPPSDTGTGTVLGDSSAKSESLTRTNDLLKSIHASEYVQLRGINAGVNNLNRSILNTVTKVFQGGGLSSVSLTQSDVLTGLSKTISTVNSVLTLGMSSLVSKIPLIGGIFDKVNNFLFGGKQTQSITGQGIQTFGTSLSDVVSGRNVRANQYADIKTHTTGGLFGSSKDSYATSYQAIGGDIQKALNDVFSNVGTNLMMVAKSLGHGLTETVSKAIIPAMRIDLMGLSGENAAKKLNNVISATMDKMSSAIFGKIVGQYQQLGEGMFETAVRVVAQIELVKDAVSQSGLKILEKDIISVSNTLVTAAGGLEAFQAQFEAYYDKFYTEAEKQQRLQTRLTETMKEAALILPATREGYRKLMEALDLTNALDQQRYTLLLELSGAADTYYSGLEKSSKVMEKQRSLDIKIMELSGNTLGALIESRKDEMAALDESLRFSQSAVYALTDANKAVADATTAANKAVSDSLSAASKAVSAAVSDVSKAIGNLSTLAQKLRSSLADNAISTIETAKKDRVDAQAVLNAALEIAKSGGAIDNFAGMDKAIADISKPSAQLYATFEEYAIDQAHTGSTITQLADYADTQISMAQLQIDAINNTTGAVKTVTESLVSLTDAQKNLATVQDQKDQIDKLLKNNIAVLSVSEAITQLSAALGVQNATTQAIAVAQQAAKTTAAAELVMNTANTKAAASASALSTAKTSVQTASDTAASLATADAAAVVKAQSNIKGLESLRDIFASVGDWATYFAYQSSIDKANKKLALLTIAAANSATSAATAAQEVLTGASYAGLTATAAADAAAAVDARAAYQTALAYSNATAAAVPNGSHKNGLDYVPFDGYVAELHKGERVLTANENLAMSAPRNNQNNVELLMELRMLRKEVEQLRLESKAGNSAIAENTKTTSKTLVKWDIDGTPAVTA